MNADGKGTIALQIEAWIRKNVQYPDKKIQGSCNKVVLRHLNIERKPQGDVSAFPVRLEEGMEDDIDPLVNNICDSAQKDADDLNQGVQTYALYAYYTLDANYVPRKLFRVSASDVEIERDLLPSEPPTEKGLVAQSMRHLESVMKTNTVSMGYLVQSQQREMQRLSEQNEKFSQQQIDFMILLQDTMDNAHRRRLEERSTEIDIAIKQSAVEKLEALVPVILNRIAGSQVLPQEDTSFMLMASLLENLTPEQQMSFFNGLSETQRVTFAEILAQYELKKEKYLEEQKKKAQPLGSKNALPPPGGEGSPQKQLSSTPPKPSDNLLIPEKDTKQIPAFKSLRERIANPTPILDKDPVIKQYEDDTTAFMNRFRDRLQGKKNPPNGE